MKIVFDASTLILLAKIELLRDVSEEVQVIIPEEVKAEFTVKRGMDAILISALIKEKKIQVRKAANRETMKKIQRDFRIETGEAQAIWLAGRLNCPIATDDGPTIKACKVIGLRFTTAIHFLLNLLSEHKLEPSIARAKLKKLSRYGRYSKEIMGNATERLKRGN
jgi:predicted nucleic acid-binding protein